MKVITDAEWEIIREALKRSIDVAVTIEADEEVIEMRRGLRAARSIEPKEGGGLTPGTMNLFREREAAMRQSLERVQLALKWVQSLPLLRDPHEEGKQETIINLQDAIRRINGEV